MATVMVFDDDGNKLIVNADGSINTQSTVVGSLANIPVELANVEGTPDAAPPAKGALIMGTDGAVARAIKTDNQGQIYVNAAGITISSINKTDRDILAEATETIVNTIAAENIKLFLPLQETSGVIAYDLLNRDIQFDISGATLAQDSVFGTCMSFDGVNDYLRHKPVTENVTSNASVSMDDTTTKLATRMVAIATNPSIVRLKIQKVGTLATATVQVAIHEDNAGVPAAAAISNGTSSAVACSSIITTSVTNRGFIFTTPPNLEKGKNYWLVFSYANSTDVSAANYIKWVEDNGTNEYGQRRATYAAAAWTAVDTKNHAFGVWGNSLTFEDDYSIILAAKDTGSAIESRYLFGTSGTVDSNICSMARSSLGYYVFRGHDGSARTINAYRYPQSLSQVFATTFSKAKDTGKINAYMNAKLVGTIAGTITTAQTAKAQPLTLGAQVSHEGTIANYYQGLMGPLIITKNELTAAQIAIVSHNLLILRKYGGVA